MSSATLGKNADNEDDQEPLWSSHTSNLAEGDADENHEALYALLNVPKSCKEEDIIRKYKQLAALLHPDRHRDPSLKAAADGRFQALSRAFEVLSDPHKRAVYDELGLEGLKTQWEVGARYKTPAEMRAEYERLGRKQLEANVETLVRSRGELTVVSDARILFLSDEERRALGGPQDLPLLQRLSTVSARQIFLKHSFTTPCTPSTSVVLTSQLVSRQGVGGGNVLAKVLYNPNSSTSIEIGTTMLRPRALSCKLTYTPDADTFVTVNMPVKTFARPPPITVTIGRRIFDQLTGTFTLSSGAWSIGSWGRPDAEAISSSTITLGLSHNTGWSAEMSSGVMAQQLSASYSMILAGVRLSVGAMATTQGAMSTYVSGDRRLTENVRAGMTLDLGMTGVMTVKLRFNRLGQRLTFPVIVSSSWNPLLILTFTAIPTLGVVAANHLIVSPRKRRKVSGRINELRQEHREYILEKRREAEEGVALLQEHVRRRIELERANQGFIVEKASYGVLEEADETNAEDPRCIDVTVALQALVANGQLVIPGGRSKSHLLGFYDCAYGERKQLRLRYTFKGRVHETCFDDRDPVACPIRSHLL